MLTLSDRCQMWTVIQQSVCRPLYQDQTHAKFYSVSDVCSVHMSQAICWFLALSMRSSYTPAAGPVQTIPCVEVAPSGPIKYQ